MARTEFSRKTRAAADKRSGGTCDGCGLPIKGRAEYDHILPAELGGDASLMNCAVLCKPCHKAKTAKDIRRIRKADRARDKDTGAMKPTRSMKSRNEFNGRSSKRKENPMPGLPPRAVYEASPRTTGEK